VSFRTRLRARAAGSGARLVFPEGDDLRVQAAAAQVARLGIAEPVLLQGAMTGDPRLVAIGDHLRARRPEAVRDGLHAVDLASDPLRFAAGMVALGDVDGCVAGAVRPTAEVLRAALWLIGRADGMASISAAMYHGLPDGRVFTFTDIAVVPTPTPEQLAASGVAAARDRRALVGDEPVVAFLSYATLGSAGGPEVERVQEAVAIFRALCPGVLADGPLQVDAAVDPAVAERKCPESPAGGLANVLVFPSLDAGNIAYKITERLAGATAAGPLLQGLARPMSDLSRGATPDDIVDVAAMVALQAVEGAGRLPEEP
jgi:phosphate acetyltransferase